MLSGLVDLDGVELLTRTFATLSALSTAASVRVELGSATPIPSTVV